MIPPDYTRIESHDLDSPATRRDIHALCGTFGAEVREIEATRDELPTLVRKAVADGMRDAMGDPDLAKKFWQGGYEHLSTHTTNGLSQWIGKRVLMILVAAALSSSIAWAVLTGRIK